MTGNARRPLGMLDAAALVVGCTIGAGIFRTASSVAGALDSPGLVMAAWAAGGIISFCGALCYAELGAAYPKSGGDYIYLTRAYGPAVGFLFGWTKVFTERIGTIAILGFVFAEYLGFLLPYGETGTRIAASIGIFLLTGLNMIGIHVGKRVQNGLTVLKIVALLAIIAAGLFCTGAQRGSASPLFPQGGVELSSFGVALVFVLWTYGGWTESAYVAEQIRDPHRSLPLSILCGLGIVTALYLAVNWVYLLFIPLSEMPGKPLVAAEVMRAAFGPAGGTVTALMVASSAFGALNGYILTSGHLLMAIGRDHALFSAHARVHPRYNTPAGALAFNALAATGLLWLGTFEQIMTYSTVVIAVFFALAALGVIVLRAREPETARPYRVWGYPVTPLIFIAAITLFVIDVSIQQPKESLLGFALALLGLPLYRLSLFLHGRRS